MLQVWLDGGGTLTVEAAHYRVATGAVPFIPPVPGLEQAGYLTPGTAMELAELPESLLVVGGNATGLELAQLFAEDHRVLTDAADHGHAEAVRLMLDLGFPPGTRSENDNGATALHLAAAAVSTRTVRLLLDHGADIEATTPIPTGPPCCAPAGSPTTRPNDAPAHPPQVRRPRKPGTS